MATFFTWEKAGQSKTLFFDVTTDEVFEQSSTATEYPVEKGVNVTDHVRRNLSRLDLEVFVSNSPIYDWNDRGGAVSKLPLKIQKYKAPLAPTPGAVFSAVGGAVRDAVGSLLGNKDETAAQVLQFRESFDAVAETLAILESLKDSVQLITVVTPYRLIDAMFIESVRIERDAGVGDGAKFRLSLRELRVVDVKLVNAPVPLQIRAKPFKPKGSQSVQEAKAPEQKRRDASWALQFLEKAGIL